LPPAAELRPARLEQVGRQFLAQIEGSCSRHAAGLGLDITFRQSSHEGELVDLIQSARQNADAIIINPAGYSFTSIAILDSIRVFEGPAIEVHISNIHARDEYHRHSKISSVASGVICGLGPYGYIAATDALARMAKQADGAAQPFSVSPTRPPAPVSEALK
jgi:3-dehydroquinate dehydratase II